MTNSRRDYLRWLAQYEAREKAGKKTGADVNGSVFTTPVVRSFSAVDGLRRGWNGKKPRTTCVALSPCVVTTRNGDTYVIGQKSTTKATARNKVQEMHNLALSLPSIHVGAND